MKGNLFLGTGRGKVGDVVFYRAMGEQLARVRIRKIKNPNTDGQIYSRALLSTVTRAYSAGRAIFDHSFEGKRVGAANQRRFSALNLDALRAQLDQELANPPQGGSGMLFVGPNATAPVGNLYIVSEGSLTNTFFSFSVDNNVQTLHWPACIANEKVGAYLTRIGVREDDIYTFVFFAVPTADEIPAENHVFGFVRLMVKAGSLESVQDCDGCGFNEVFDVLDSSFVASTSSIFSAELTDASMRATAIIDTVDNNYEVISIACIKSRYNQDLRSTERMVWAFPSNHGKFSSSQVVVAWSKVASDLPPTLILEGSAQVDNG